MIGLVCVAYEYSTLRNTIYLMNADNPTFIRYIVLYTLRMHYYI